MADDILEHPAVSRIRSILDGLDVEGQIVVLDNHARTAALAAEALGVPVGAIANSVVFITVDHNGARAPLLVMASGAHRCDLRRLTDALAVTAIEKADASYVREHTGVAIGGVSPVGHPRPIRTLVDVALAGYDQVWAAAGHPRTVFPTHYDELLRITAGEPIEVA